MFNCFTWALEQKIFLKKGETKQVDFIIKADDLKFYNHQMEFDSEPGDYELFIADNSNHMFTHKFLFEYK